MPDHRHIRVLQRCFRLLSRGLCGYTAAALGVSPPCHYSVVLILAEVTVKKISLFLAVLGLSVAGSALAAKTTKEISQYPVGERGVYSERATAERIKAVGTVCVEGKECAGVAASAAASTAGGAARSGEQVYNANCAGCHGAGVMGAPKFADKGAWAPRIAKGKDTLYKHALGGFNAMPPKGMCMNCSDDEIKATVDYMISKAK
jgi:cytochrome c5